MKAILISDHAKWCALMMNGEKTIEVRKNKALATAIQKLIDEYGYADIYVYCSKSNYLGYISNKYAGKVIFKFRCYKVEEIVRYDGYFYTPTYEENEICQNACLSWEEIHRYLAYKETGYAIHISDLEIFDKPKELSEFYKVGAWKVFEEQLNTSWIGSSNQEIMQSLGQTLTKAPQNFYYVEVE